MSNIDWEDLDRIYQVLSRIEDLLISRIEADHKTDAEGLCIDERCMRDRPEQVKKPLPSALERG